VRAFLDDIEAPDEGARVVGLTLRPGWDLDERAPQLPRYHWQIDVERGS
jgi:hypothetical protein